MKTLQEKLSDVELEMQNLTMFITQCTATLKCKICEYHRLQTELYVQDGLEKAQEYVDSLG